MIEIITEKELKELSETYAYTITGVGGDLEEWKAGYERLLTQEEIGTPKTWYSFTGRLMNQTFNLTGSNRYKNDLTFLCFPLEGLNVGKLALLKLKMQDRWLDDIIDNNSLREKCIDRR